MSTKIQKWGNSLAVRLPKEVVQKLRLKKGNEVEVREEKKRIVIRKAPTRDAMFNKNVWRQFLIPTHREKEDVSGNVDEILYGASSR